MAKLLLVDDDSSLASLVEAYLVAQKHTVEVAHTGRHAEDLLKRYEYDVLILDWRLPDVMGPEICRNLRKKGSVLPILMLTGNNAIEQKEYGFDAGADDYVTKPFDMRELAARVRALLRRPSTLIEEVLQAGDVTLNPTTREVAKAGRVIKIFPKEYAILEYLLRHPNKVLNWQSIVDHVWRSDEGVGQEGLRTSIGRLRKQIDTAGEPSLIQNVHGVGYLLRTAAAAEEKQKQKPAS